MSVRGDRGSHFYRQRQRRLRERRQKMIIGAAGAVLVVSLSVFGISRMVQARSGKHHQSTAASETELAEKLKGSCFINDIDISGMTKEAAREAVLAKYRWNLRVAENAPAETVESTSAESTAAEGTATAAVTSAETTAAEISGKNSLRRFTARPLRMRMSGAIIWMPKDWMRRLRPRQRQLPRNGTEARRVRKSKASTRRPMSLSTATPSRGARWMKQPWRMPLRPL